MAWTKKLAVVVEFSKAFQRINLDRPCWMIHDYFIIIWEQYENIFKKFPSNFLFLPKLKIIFNDIFRDWKFKSMLTTRSIRSLQNQTLSLTLIPPNKYKTGQWLLPERGSFTPGCKLSRNHATVSNFSPLISKGIHRGVSGQSLLSPPSSHLEW